MNITAQNLINKCIKNVPDSGAMIETNDWFFYFTEAIREIRAGRTFPWQRRKTIIEFFTNVFEYKLPDDFDSFIKPHKDIQSNSDNGPFLLYGRDKDFFANYNYGLALEWNREIRTLLARQESEQALSMDSFEEDVDVYTLTGDADNASSDTVYYKGGASSLRFDITSSSGQAIISRTKDEEIDLTNLLNKGYVLLWIYMPTVIDSVQIIYGNDSSNYYHITATKDYSENDFTTGWNLVKLNMADATLVGTVDITLIDYYSIVLNHTSVTDTDFRIDELSFHLPSILELPYNSKNIVKNESNEYIEEVTAVTDTILCDETFEAVLMYKALHLASMFKLRDADLTTVSESKYKERMMEFNRRYPSTEAPLQSNYYKKFNNF